MTRRAFLGGCAAVLLHASSVWAQLRLRFLSYTPRVDDVIPVSLQAAGTLSANAFAGFTSPAATVFASGGLKYLRPTVAYPNNEILLATTTSGQRDQQITTYIGKGALYLRIIGTPGAQKCLCCLISPPGDGNRVRIGILSGWDETQNLIDTVGTFYPLYTNDDPASTLAGFNALDGTGSVTFGAAGFSVYLKINGTTVVSLTEWRHMDAGRAAVYVHSNYGARDVTVSYPAVTLYSDCPGNVYDIRDFGARALTAIGSMTSGSPTLTLVSNPGFVVGQKVIVAVGGESGSGLRGSKGVGGQWPLLSYANTTAMNADTSKAANTWAYDASTNLVYSWNGVIWDHRNDGAGTFNQSYYSEKIVPKALLATITAVAGNVLTLDTSSTVATTSATVYLDCADCFNILTDTLADNYPAPSTLTLSIPAGTFALSRKLTGTRPGLTCKGVSNTTSILTSPDGTPSVGIVNSFCDNAVMRDFGVLGNFGDDGYGLNIDSSDRYQSVNLACSVDHAAGASLLRIAATDVFADAAQLDACTNGTIDGCSATLTAIQRAYNGWQIQISSGTNCVMKNCTGTSPYLFKCFECFNSVGCYMEDLSGQNTLYSNNSSGAPSGKGSVRCAVTITANSFATSLASAIDEAVFNLNANYAPGTDAVFTGWTVKARVIQQGYIDASHNSLQAIKMQSPNINVSVIGDYPEAGTHTTLGWGYFEAPNYDAGSAEWGSQAVRSAATGTAVTGIRVAGTSKTGSGGGNIQLDSTGGSVTNCVADVINGGTQSGNQNNAGY